MNCKQGDLAIVVRSMAGNEGKIVKCVRYVGVIEYQFPDGSIHQLDSWEVDSELMTAIGSKTNIAIDIYLTPLRGDILDDEITTSRELEAA